MIIVSILVLRLDQFLCEIPWEGVPPPTVDIPLRPSPSPLAEQAPILLRFRRERQTSAERYEYRWDGTVRAFGPAFPLPPLRR